MADERVETNSNQTDLDRSRQLWVRASFVVLLIVIIADIVYFGR